jgi:hypothetical protein
MTIKALLTALLPTDGYYCVVGLKSDTPAIQKFVEDIDAVEAEATALSNSGYNAYFGCAKYATDKNRKAPNVKSAQCFWLDIDCYDDKPYADQQEGMVALKKFCAALSLPRPTIVDSGRGFHVYWQLQDPITPEQWKRTAVKLKKLCNEHNLQTDPSRTADIASILRLPDTKNYKTNPALDVKLITIGKPVTYDAFNDLLGVEIQSTTPAPTYDTGGLNELTKSLMGNKQNKFSLILEKSTKGTGCEHIKQAFEHQDKTTEPLWRAVLSVASRCVDSETAIHEISKQHPQYNAEETEEKAARTTGPYLCSTFETIEPSHCANCPHKGKISSPIVLGQVITEASPSATTVGFIEGDPTAVSTYAIPPLPFPYFAGKTTGIYRKSSDDEEDATLVYEHYLYIVKRLKDPQKGEVVWLRLHTPKDGVREFALTAMELMTPDRLRERLAWFGVVGLKKQMDSIMQYLVYFLKELQNTTGAEHMRNQFGWTENNESFVVGDVEIRADGDKYTPPSSYTNQYCQAFESVGTFEEWKKVINVYDRAGFEPHAFGFFTAFGAPLMKFMNQAGAIINMVNNASGTGKTTSIKCMHSVYGHPEEMMLIEKDTPNTRLHRLGVMNNLPLGCDEITKMPSDDFSDFAYSVSQGRGRGRMKMNENAERLNFARWSTILLCSSNASVVDKLKSLTTSDGELMRVIEFNVPESKLLPKEEADEVYGKLYTNYGHAGKIYLRDLVANLEERIGEVRELQRHIDKKAGFTNRERFWSAVAACNIAGAQFARRLGIHDIDVGRVFRWAIQELSQMRNEIKPPATNHAATIADFWNKYSRNTLVINGEVDRRTNVESLPIREPYGELVVRMEPDTQKLYIDAKVFRKFCQDIRVTVKDIIGALTAEGVCEGIVQKRMHKGTKLSSVPAIMAYAFDCSKGNFIDTEQYCDPGMDLEELKQDAS